MDGERHRRREDELRTLGLLPPTTPGGGRRNSGGGGGRAFDGASLLHKLLRRDGERERRLTLQLLRYIVDCDHFRDEDASGGAASSSCAEAGVDIAENAGIYTSR